MKTVKELLTIEIAIAEGTTTTTTEQLHTMCEEQEGIRVCEHCGALMWSGYLVGGCSTFCSIEHAYEGGAVSAKDVYNIKYSEDYDDDDFFYTQWEEEEE